MDVQHKTETRVSYRGQALMLPFRNAEDAQGYIDRAVELYGGLERSDYKILQREVATVAGPWSELVGSRT